MASSFDHWGADNGGSHLRAERRIWKVRYVLIIFFWSLFLFFMQGIGGQIEGRLFPVVDGTTIAISEPVGETRTRIWGEFDKLRDCQYEGLEFRLGTPGSSIHVDFTFEEGAKHRAPGRETFGPWLVHLTEDQLTNRAFSIVYHRCHPFWLTETRFYP